VTTTVVALPTLPSGFTSYDAEFVAVTGRNPVLAKVLDIEAHEGPVYIAGEDALYFTTLPRVRREQGRDVPVVDIGRLALDGYRFPVEPERVTVVRPHANAANGMTLAPDGSLLVCEQGSWFTPARLSRVDPRSGAVVTVVDRGARGRLGSPNDVAVRADGTIWFTDPSYGFLQHFRPRPDSPDAVYRVDPVTGSVAVVDDTFDKPNGVAFSPDGSVLYVTDSGANHEPGSFEPSRPHRVVALDLDANGEVLGRRVLADVNPGFPDGVTTDEKGRVYASSFSGVQVFTPEGRLLGQIDVPGAVNFTFGGPGGDVLFITADTAVWAAVLDTRGA
jgi:gluconolactonase